MLFQNVKVDGLNIFYREPATKARRSSPCSTVSRLRPISIAI
jgi:hypothetical protein